MSRGVKPSGPCFASIANIAFAGATVHRVLANRGCGLDVEKQVREILRDVLSLGGRADRLAADSALLGALPELDSMAVAGVLAAIEDRFGLSVDDDEISGATFATFGSLVDFVSSKIA